MGIHTEEQLQSKRDAITIATDTFVIQYHEGKYEDNEPYLHQQIESLHQLVRELNQG